MSEAADFDPGIWRGHDFAAARTHYDAHAGRSYTEAINSNKTSRDLLPNKLITQARRPLVINCDQTGSMGEWPVVIFSKLAYLEIEAKNYLGDDLEISFGATGDATHYETYPVQARPFSKGLDLKTRLEELVIEKKGGGGAHETYELSALYYARNVEMPNAIQPILIFIGDEQPYDYAKMDLATRYANTKLEFNLPTPNLFQELRRLYSVYLVRKPYGEIGAPLDREIYQNWARLIGEDHIAPLPDPQRVVDVIFGILARETDRFPYFREELEGRQKPDQITTVYKSLQTIHTFVPDDDRAHTGRSVMHKPIDGEDSKPLL